MIGITVLSIVACAAQVALARVPKPHSPPLPVVDLGYGLYEASLNETGRYYNFTNIRYAAPPTGDRRFAAPVKPTEINRNILNRDPKSIVCAQATPFWQQTALYNMQGASLATLEMVETLVEATENSLNISSTSASTTSYSEDCLFLDVIVPETIYNEQAESCSSGVPVIVWIYGGGYVNGDKTSAGNPATLISRAQENGGEGVVYVALNYRLGLFGWLSGPSFEESGDANLGLLDQRLALEWVQENIYLFGGDPDRVTVIGQSAGGGSIMHQITAYGGSKGPVPFSQAIIQSPGFPPISGDAQQEATFQSVISQAQTLIDGNITSVSDLRSLNFTTLAALNIIVTARAPYGRFVLGPAVDGTFVPKLPGVLLLEGSFDQNVNVMTSHNSDEGFFFTSPFIQTESNVTDTLRAVIPTASNSTLSYVTNTLYPPVYDGSYPYTTLFNRSNLITAELSFTCNARFLNTAFNNATHSYYFAVPPGLHGEDVAYTFFNGDTTTDNDGLPVVATIAAVLQRYITNFATTGNPNGKGVPYFPEYQSNATNLVLGLGDQMGSLVVDDTANERCAWWQPAVYADETGTSTR